MSLEVASVRSSGPKPLLFSFYCFLGLAVICSVLYIAVVSGFILDDFAVLIQEILPNTAAPETSISITVMPTENTTEPTHSRTTLPSTTVQWTTVLVEQASINATVDTDKIFRQLCANNCISFSEISAGMGNYLFFYATSMGVGLQTNRTLIVADSTYKFYAQWFANLTCVRDKSKDFLNTFEDIKLEKANWFYPHIYKTLQEKKNFRLSGYLQSFKYFDNFSEAIKVCKIV